MPKKGGRLWKLYLNGAHIHRLAVFYGPKRQYVVWIDNTLGDVLTEQDDGRDRAQPALGSPEVSIAYASHSA